MRSITACTCGRFLVILLLCLPLPLVAGGPAPVWSVSKDGQQIFIGGTMHMLPQSAFPLPEPFEFAYDLAGVLVFETDMQGLKAPEIQTQLVNGMMLPAGQHLRDQVSPETYRLLLEFLADRGLAKEGFSRMKPAMVGLALTTAELQRLGLGQAGVDEFFLQQAMQDGKRISWLENIEAHLDYIFTMGDGAEDQFLKFSLQDIGELEAYMNEMIATWRVGDRAALYDMFVRDMREPFPRLYERLLVERNNAWMPRIRAMLETPDIEFVLVGAAHLVGEEGLLQQMEQGGYSVVQLQAATSR